MTKFDLIHLIGPRPTVTIVSSTSRFDASTPPSPVSLDSQANSNDINAQTASTTAQTPVGSSIFVNHSTFS